MTMWKTMEEDTGHGHRKSRQENHLPWCCSVEMSVFAVCYGY